MADLSMGVYIPSSDTCTEGLMHGFVTVTLARVKSSDITCSINSTCTHTQITQRVSICKNPNIKISSEMEKRPPTFHVIFPIIRNRVHARGHSASATTSPGTLIIIKVGNLARPRELVYYDMTNTPHARRLHTTHTALPSLIHPTSFSISRRSPRARVHFLSARIPRATAI